MTFNFIALLFLSNLQSQIPESLSQKLDKEALTLKLKNPDLDKSNRIKNLKALAKLYYYKEPDSVAHYLSSALSLSLVTNDSIEISDAYIGFSLNELFQDNYNKTILYADSAISYLSNKNPEHFVLLGYANRIQGMSYNNKEKMDLALEKILQANQILSEIPSDSKAVKYLTRNYNDLAFIYRNIDHSEEAIKTLQRSLRISKPNKELLSIGEAYNLLGLVYTDLKKYTIAENYLDSANSFYKKANYNDGLLTVAINKGDLYTSKKKYEKAIGFYKTSLDLANQLSDSYSKIESFLDLSNAYTKNKDLKNAQINLDSAKAESIQVNYTVFDNDIAFQNSDILEKKKKYKEAISTLLDVLPKMKAEKLKDTEMRIYLELSTLFKKEKNTSKSYEYYKKYKNLEDTLNQELQNNKLNVLKVEYNYNQLITELENKETALALVTTEKRRVAARNYFFIGIGLLIAIFSAFMFFRERKLNRVRRTADASKQELLRLKKQAVESEMKFKNKQITDFAIHISEKNELLEKIKSKLKKIKVTNNVYKEMVTDTLHFINNDIEQNKEKIQLYQQVNQTTDSFRAKIDERYTNLSEKEKKIATMLRLGQTSKQIALQLNISSASVDNYRYNLRKKMSIPKGSSLKSFIQSI